MAAGGEGTVAGVGEGAWGNLWSLCVYSQEQSVSRSGGGGSSRALSRVHFFSEAPLPGN